MARFRELTADDVTTILAAFGLTGYIDHQPIAAGTINTNVRVRTSDGTFFVRINEGKAAADVEREAAIVTHLAARGVPTPAPRQARDGRPFAAWNGELASVFPWLEGRTLTRAEVGVPEAQQAGRALAQMHVAGADFSDHRPGRYEPDEIARRLATVAALNRPELADAVARLRPALVRLAHERRPDLPLGLIHGDLFIDNVLYLDAPGERRLTALLDFEQASWGRLTYDIAVAVLAFAFGSDGDFRADVTRAFLAAYAAVRRPGPTEAEGLGAELQFAACRFAVTRITDVHLRREAGAPGGKDFRRYLARLEAVERHLRTDSGLFRF